MSLQTYLCWRMRTGSYNHEDQRTIYLFIMCKMLQLAKGKHRCCSLSLLIVWIMQPDRIPHVDEAWLKGQCLKEPSGTKETGLFYTNYYPLCCHLSLLNRTFLNSASVSVFCSFGTISLQVSSDALSFHGDGKYQPGGEFSRTHVTVDIPLPTGQMTPLGKKVNGIKRVLVECSSTCQEVTSEVSDMLVQQPQRQPCATLYTKPVWSNCTYYFSNEESWWWLKYKMNSVAAAWGGGPKQHVSLTWNTFYLKFWKDGPGYIE